MFDDILIESGNKPSARDGWLTVLFSLIVHTTVLGSVMAAGYYARQHPDMVRKPISAFVVAQAPAPPPPPPPPAASSKSTAVKIEQPNVRKASFVTPNEIPKETPQPDATSEKVDEANGVAGGQQGGVEAGIVGGVIGGVAGGVLGGQLGGTGTGPLRVGGNVLAPQVLQRIEPQYTSEALLARVQGIVILEAIIDIAGRVTDVRVLKPLPKGLDASAMDAVRQWRFKPGTLDGNPVPVIFNLTVNFRLQD